MSENSSRGRILSDIRRTLGRTPESPVLPRPPIVPARRPASREQEIAKLMEEISVLKGAACRLEAAEIPLALGRLVQAESIYKATLWNTPRLRALGVPGLLQDLQVKLISAAADKTALAEADLGITEVDFALPETGTLGLLSSPDKPRAVSLLPRVHLAILHPGALRRDLHDVFAEAKREGYLVFITGPSRTADIELITTIGVHGPKSLYVWVIGD